jgi:hypothetical protein
MVPFSTCTASVDFDAERLRFADDGGAQDRIVGKHAKKGRCGAPLLAIA